MKIHLDIERVDVALIREMIREANPDRSKMLRLAKHHMATAAVLMDLANTDHLSSSPVVPPRLSLISREAIKPG